MRCLHVCMSASASAHAVSSLVQHMVDGHDPSCRCHHKPPLRGGCEPRSGSRGIFFLCAGYSSAGVRATSFAARIPTSYSRHIGIASISCEITSGGVTTAAITKMPTMA